MRVRLFVTCLVDMFRPETGKAAVRVLERRGAQLSVPAGQTCCGQFAYNAGYRDEARAMARHYLDVFADSGEEPGPVVTLSGSCAAMVREIYPDLVADDPRAASVSTSVVELSEWLSAYPGPETDRRDEPCPVAFHNGCHMRRMLRVNEEPLQVLRTVGADPRTLRDADQCCGFGGTYSMSEPEVSTALADAKLVRWEEAKGDGARALVGADWGCLIHMAGRLSRLERPSPVLHLADLVDLADSGPLSPERIGARAVFSDPRAVMGEE